jgi:hypothetical protein
MKFCFSKKSPEKKSSISGEQKDTTRQEMSGIGNEESVSNGGGKF